MANSVAVPIWWDCLIVAYGLFLVVFLWILCRQLLVMKIAFFVTVGTTLWMFTLPRDELLAKVFYVFENYLRHSPFVMMLAMFVAIVIINAISYLTVVLEERAQSQN